jgi:hypothetical protein
MRVRTPLNRQQIVGFWAAPVRLDAGRHGLNIKSEFVGEVL